MGVGGGKWGGVRCVMRCIAWGWFKALELPLLMRRRLSKAPSSSPQTDGKAARRRAIPQPTHADSPRASVMGMGASKATTRSRRKKAPRRRRWAARMLARVRRFDTLLFCLRSAASCRGAADAAAACRRAPFLFSLSIPHPPAADPVCLCVLWRVVCEPGVSLRVHARCTPAAIGWHRSLFVGFLGGGGGCSS